MQNILIKTEAEIAKMRVAGRLAAEVLTMIEPFVTVGTSTELLNQICHDYIVNKQQAIPAPLNYRGFPKSICTSVNQEVCHGIPSPDRILKDGDIINIDITVIKDGYHGDTSKMFLVKKAPNPKHIQAQRLINATQEALYAAIRLVKPGVNLNVIARAIMQIAKRERLGIVEEYCGHGIGRGFHEDPQVPHYVCAQNERVVLQPGMTFTIEPMLNLGTKAVKLKPDNWTVVTRDHKLSAQFEHTILVTETGYEVLTLRPEENDQLYSPSRS